MHGQALGAAARFGGRMALLVPSRKDGWNLSLVRRKHGDHKVLRAIYPKALNELE
jgi:hypothetical protein